MYTSVFPLPAIAFQTLFLLIAIAIEAFVIRRELQMTYKKSIEYATTINLLTLALGWLLFFNLQLLLPLELKLQLINFIFFNHWRTSTALVILVAFFTFFASFFIKLQGFNLLQRLLQEYKPSETASGRTRRYPSLRHQPEIERETPKQANAILIANAASYSAILVVLFLQFLIIRLSSVS